MYNKNLWTASDLRKLESYCKRGLTSREAADKLKRGHAATRYKAHKLGLSFWSYGARR